MLVVEHSDEGALGIVLNRPGEIAAREALPDPLGTALAEEELLHQGGPVEPGSVIVLADFADPGLAAGIAFGSVGVVDPDGDLDALAEAVRAVRAFSGYAGWAAGQLESEIAQDAWIDAAATPEDVFTSEPGGLWSAVLERKGGSYRLVARMPEDPALN